MENQNDTKPEEKTGTGQETNAKVKKGPKKKLNAQRNRPSDEKKGKGKGSPGKQNAAKNVQKHLSENKQAAAKVKEIRTAAARVPIDYEANARKRRRKRSLQLIWKLIAFVVIPTITSAVYYGFLAKSQYQSISAVSVQTEGKGGLGIDSVIGSFAATGSSKDAITVQEYILSRDMLRLMDDKQNFIEHYKNPKIDYLSRLPQDATFEYAYEYYLETVEAVYNTESGILSLAVKAFDPGSAQRFSREILKFAEKKVNQLSSKMQQDKITFSATIVKKAEKRLTAAQEALMKIQQEQADFSPDHSAQAMMGVKSQLEGQLAMAQTELDQLLATMAPTAPQVLAQKHRVQSIRNQIRKENKRLLGNDEGGMGTNIAEFEMAMLEKQFAQKEYESAMVSLELARIEAMKQTRYLAEISSPSLPDEATFPRRGLKVLTMFLVSLAIFGVFSLVLSAIKEHARI